MVLKCFLSTPCLSLVSVLSTQNDMEVEYYNFLEVRPFQDYNKRELSFKSFIPVILTFFEFVSKVQLGECSLAPKLQIAFRSRTPSRTTQPWIFYRQLLAGTLLARTIANVLYASPAIYMSTFGNKHPLRQINVHRGDLP